MKTFLDFKNELEEADSIQTRMKKRRAMRKNKAKIACPKESNEEKNSRPEETYEKAKENRQEIKSQKES